MRTRANHQDKKVAPSDETSSSQSVQENQTTADLPGNAASNVQTKIEEIPDRYNLDVPFMTQAPLYVWDALHEDACEEASLLMLYHYINQNPIESRQNFEEEIQYMISYEENNGYGNSITLKELAQLSKDYIKIDSLEVKNISNPEELKTIIFHNGPIVVGAAGKELKNPNFRNGGPNYHMLVVKGYDQNGFVTNDPGTRNGENYYYAQDVLFNAIHDWNSNDILLGNKNVLLISR